MSENDITYHDFQGETKESQCRQCALPYSSNVHNPCREVAERFACVAVWCLTHHRPERVPVDPDPLVLEGGWYAEESCEILGPADSEAEAEELARVLDPEGYLAFRRSMGGF